MNLVNGNRIINPHQNTFIRKRAFWIVLSFLFIILEFIQISSILTDAQTVDEGPHILAGYAYLKTGKILLNPEHPPLLKSFAALPLLVLNPDLPEEVKNAAKSPTELDQWSLSYDFLYKNRVPADTMIFWTRLMMIILTSLGALAIALIARRWFGDIAGIAAFVLFAFDPNVLAHGRLVTTDTGSAIFIFLAVIVFLKFLNFPKKSTAIFSGIVFGLALATKFSSLVLIPVFLILFLIKLFQDEHQNIPLPLKKWIKFALLTTIAAFATLWLVYDFNIEKPFNDPKVRDLYQLREVLAADPNAYQKDQNGDYRLARWIIKNFNPKKQPGTTFFWLAKNAPVPAYRYFRGLSDFLAHDYRGHYAYLTGNIYEAGMWQYFIIAYLIKSPIPLLLLLVFSISVFALTWTRSDKSIKLKMLRYANILKFQFADFPLVGYALIISPAVYWLMSLNSHINLGIRHLMPVYPLYAVTIAAALVLVFKKAPNGSPFFQKSQLFDLKPRVALFFRISVVFLLVWFLLEGILITPYHLSYFNELIGGPKNGYQYLLDSNIDWGQDFLRLKKYMKDNNLDWVYLRYFGKTDWNYYGVKGYEVPTTKEIAKNGLPNGVVVISLTPLFLFNIQEFLWLQSYEPTGRIGYSMWVYDFRR